MIRTVVKMKKRRIGVIWRFLQERFINNMLEHIVMKMVLSWIHLLVEQSGGCNINLLEARRHLLICIMTRMKFLLRNSVWAHFQPCLQ